MGGTGALLLADLASRVVAFSPHTTMVEWDDCVLRLNAALRYACVSGSLPVVEELLSRGADVNAHDEQFLDFPLASAVREKNLELVARLLKAGANPNMHDVVDETDDQSSTLRMSLIEFSALKSTREITKMLMGNVKP